MSPPPVPAPAAAPSRVLSAAPASPPGPAHLFTVDVEEYFQVSAFDRVLDRARWGEMESRVERSVDTLLELLDRHGASGTFFTLGWVAAARPGVVRRIAEAGHEVASHGWSHRRVYTLRPGEFREEVHRSRALLEGLAGRAVVGFRAPSFSILPGCEWAFDILLDEGYRYDSSLFPIRRPGYGYPDAPTRPHRIERTPGDLLEVPMTTTSLAGLRLPAAGGAYFRHFPYALTRRALREKGREGGAGVFYVHPWEIDPGQPRLPAGRVTRARHYGGLARTLRRLERLLAEFRFTSVAARFGFAEALP